MDARPERDRKPEWIVISVPRLYEQRLLSSSVSVLQTPGSDRDESLLLPAVTSCKPAAGWELSGLRRAWLQRWEAGGTWRLFEGVGAAVNDAC